MKPVLERCKALLPPLVKERTWLPYLAPALDAGMATFFAEEIIEAIRYLEDPNFYVQGEDPTAGQPLAGRGRRHHSLRKRGVEFVDGTAPGFAAILGAAPTKEIAAKIAQELQEKNLYVFMAARAQRQALLRAAGGGRRADRLAHPPGLLRPGLHAPRSSPWASPPGRPCPSAASQPGDYRKILIYNKDRVFAFALPLGFVTDEWYANAAGAINWGFPVIADTPIPQVLPTGICTYEHVVSNIPHDQIVQKAVEVRGLKVTVAKVPIPVAYGPAFEGERIRGEDIYLECGGGRTHRRASGPPPGT